MIIYLIFKGNYPSCGHLVNYHILPLFWTTSMWWTDQHSDAMVLQTMRKQIMIYLHALFLCDIITDVTIYIFADKFSVLKNPLKLGFESSEICTHSPSYGNSSFAKLWIWFMFCQKLKLGVSTIVLFSPLFGEDSHFD